MNKRRILFLDTYYPDFIRSIPDACYWTNYAEVLRQMMLRMFGTGDSYSYWMKDKWETCDVIANDERLQRSWTKENARWDYNHLKGTAFSQIQAFKPEILFLQDLSFFTPTDIDLIRDEMKVKIIAAQCSCPMPPVEHVKYCDVIFTSFPHYLEEFKKLGVRGEFSRLAFDPRILKLVRTRESISNTITFVGGVGYPSHWKMGLEVLETIAQRIPEFIWFGYGQENLPASSELKKKYRGQAWGTTMYQILSDSAIVLNRHGEVSKQYANNMKLFETTGMGALLLTDHKSNMSEMFEIGKECVTYTSPEHAADLARFYIEHPHEAAEIAAKGQIRTLLDHTYEKKMAQISKILEEMI